jgi:VWFA-related protein
MSTLHGLCLALVFWLLSPISAQQARVPAEPNAAGGSSTPASQVQPLTSQPAFAANEPEGLIHLDVVVTDRAGKPVSGMDRSDFTLLDNGQSEKIVSFHAFGGINARPNPPTAVILLIDTRDVPGETASDVHQAVEKFLRHNGGRLAEPVTIYSFEGNNWGFWLEAGPSFDGNALAEAVEDRDKVALLRPPPVTFQLGELPANLKGNLLNQPYPRQPRAAALMGVAYILAAERQKAGRKLLLWVGPGVIGSGAYPEPTDPADRQDIFDKIYWFSTLLREARVTLYTFSIGDNNPGISKQPGYWGLRDPWKGFLNGVKSADQATTMNLYRKVLAIESGGDAPLSENDVERQMDACLQDASTFYTLTFDPPLALRAAEYHDLKVEMRKPGLTARTVTGYYDEPFYDDAANPEIRRVTAAELEQIAGSARGESDGDVARQLSKLELTERLSEAKQASLTGELRGKKTRQTLEALADVAAFLEPPASEIPADAPPDQSAQRHILALAGAYLNQAMTKLPDFFATRITDQYGETPAYEEGNTRFKAVPLHVTEHSRATMLYRQGAEVMDAAVGKRVKQNRGLSTNGTFGPLLRVVQSAMDLSGAVTWSRWEQDAGERRAVFRYRVPAERSLYAVDGCCLPSGDGSSDFAIKPGYHGEIAVDPASGAILRVEVEADLEGFVPLKQSDIMVSYGPVAIGGKVYILPVRSVHIWRKRTVPVLEEWNAGFNTWGPYATVLNQFTFEDYHMFRGESRMLSAFQ